MISSIIKKPLFFNRNRVFRIYKGGRLFQQFFGDKDGDGNFPEEWIASSVHALNKDSTNEAEGLSTIKGTQITFASLLKNHPAEMTNNQPFNVLVKMLDSAVRLPAQAHPDKAFSRAHFQSDFGKTEMWLILATRPGAKIYFGFKDNIARTDLEKAVINSQHDSSAFTKILHEWDAIAGDVWLIPAKTAHAIGAGCLILEVQEPTDFTIQPEHWCDNYRLSAQEMYLGLSPNIALDCFDLSISGKDAIDRGKKKPVITGQSAGYTKEALITYQDTPCFAVNRHTLQGSQQKLVGPAVFVVTQGEGNLQSGETAYPIKKGGYFFLPYAAGKILLESATKLQVVECLPPSEIPYLS